ncbi:T9SS type A sorting domain-containing protein [Tenacibaculum sp. 190524A02b]|uniref:T9SS type A sorting domain-containing protein n=1 Tax=Tenacibaculum vairaonense TaxID=3137860 RepID=UPI0031FAAEED
MKRIYLVLIFLVFGIKLKAQSELVVGDLKSPMSLDVKNNRLLVLEIDDTGKKGNVVKIDLVNGSKETIVNNIEEATVVKWYKEEFIIVQDHMVSLYDKDGKFKFRIAHGASVGDIVLLEDIMYYSDRAGKKIYKVDLTKGPLALIDRKEVIGNLDSPTSLAINGNELYFVEEGSNVVSKLNLAEEFPSKKKVFDGIPHRGAIETVDNVLYIGGLASNKILKVDLTQSSLVGEDYVSGVAGPLSLVSEEDYLYYIEFSAGKVFKIKKAEVLSTETYVVKKILSPYPNPTTTYLNFSNEFLGKKMTIHNVLGQVVITKNKLNNKISVSKLQNGTYFVKVGNQLTKFIKN